ncbi:hypothetical protein FACS189445_5970 [Spirochaetia bacterium]|nr:hypothetical protein FACS189445_5970 [Spirochaetia bacterium]
MTIEQTIDIPANREVTIRLVVPESVPCGKQAVILDFPLSPPPASDLRTADIASRHEQIAKDLAKIRALCKGSSLSVDSLLEERHAERDREYEDIE